MKMRIPSNNGHILFTSDCRQARWIEFDYLWYKQKLISQLIYNAKIPANDHHQVRVFANSFMGVSKMREILKDRIKPWQLEGGIRHNKYPLIYYPRFYWDNPDVPPKAKPPDRMWGVYGLENKILKRPFLTSCMITPTDQENDSTIADWEFANIGDAKCRGTISAVKGDLAVSAMIDVWAPSAQQIVEIYEAVIDELESYMQDK